MEERLAQSKTFASRLRQAHLYIFKFLGVSYILLLRKSNFMKCSNLPDFVQIHQRCLARFYSMAAKNQRY